ncbi:hypothetical protein LTR09_005232 [Extremus antarcticus]|uniref:Major facilitator superfamily (MFS) profile domain-containing protein n=1 Tax=Extremus antarcticus TaxID=702011 RepID=A0AAJ0GDS4_9PEZI|nr:hypothetical protein LTR09_005232 [Extremus antarcticus]
MDDTISDKSRKESSGAELHEHINDDRGTEKADTTSQPHNDPQLDKRINRKFDLHIVPILFGLWLFAFVDRANIGNARIDGLAEDLKLTGTKFNVVLAVFYVPYICVDVPSNLVLKYFQAGYYLPSLLIGWGLVATFTGFVKSYEGLIAARFFLGLCEGGLLGGMIIYLAMFYCRHEIMKRIGFFYSAAPLSGAFGGLLATGLAQISTPGYNGWPFIFFIEGAITVSYGILVLFFLPHTPNDAKFLPENERRYATNRLRLDAHGAANTDAKDEEFSWTSVKRALLNWNTLLMSFDFFLLITPIYSYSLFLPTIIKALGFDPVIAQLLTVPPNMCGFFSVLLACQASDKYQKRGMSMLIGLAVAIAGYIMLISTPNVWTQYGGTFLVGAGIFPCSPLIMGWLANNLAPHYVRATGTGFQIMVANFAAFVATFTYIETDAPGYITGHAINIGALALALLTTTILIFYNTWENKQRDGGKRDYRLQEEDESTLGYRHPSFRYTV